MIKWYKGSRLKKIIDFIVKLVKINGFFYMPSSLAFYLIISCIPLISIIFMILSFYSHSSSDSIIAFLEAFNSFSDGTIDSIIAYLQDIKTSDYITLIASTVASIYVASRAIECFSRFSDRFYGREKLNNHFFKRKVRSIAITFVFIVLISIVVIIPTIIAPLTAAITNQFIGNVVKYGSLFVFLFIAFMFMFKYSPTEKRTMWGLAPGVLFCTFGSTISIFVYSIYINFAMNHLSSLYGPLTSIIILLFVALLISYIMMIGFYLNILIEEYQEKRKIIKYRGNNPAKTDLKLVQFTSQTSENKILEPKKPSIVIIKEATAGKNNQSSK